MSPTSRGKGPSKENPSGVEGIEPDRSNPMVTKRRGATKRRLFNAQDSETPQPRSKTGNSSGERSSNGPEGPRQGQLSKTFKPNPFPPNLPQPKQLAAWFDWKKQFELSMCLAGKLSQQEKASCLYLCIGDEMREVISTHEMMPSGSDVGENFQHCDKLIEKLDGYFSGAADDTFDLNTFFAIKQEQDETAQKFETRVLRQARVCDLQYDTRIIRAAYVKGMKDDQTRKLANANNWEMAQIVKAAARSEAYAGETAVTDPWKAIVPKREEVCAVESSTKAFQPKGDQRFQRYQRPGAGDRPKTFGGQGRFSNRFTPRVSSSARAIPSRNCNKCGLSTHKFGTCPAIGKNCIRCGKEGHFQFVCQANVNAVDDRNGSEEKVEILPCD